MAVVREQGPSLSYEVDTLGFFNAQLRDLRGLLTLAQELIQNADDGKASEIIFDATDEALVVENDKVFTDCGQVEETVCRLGDDVMCDFHRFRRVASGGKRLQDGTTGAFGIGFISVYQITDSPEVESGSWGWRIDLAGSASERIKTQRLSPASTRTIFRLPWARELTWLRNRLGAEPVPADAADRFVLEVRDGVTRSLLFLRHLNAIELRRNGQPFGRFLRLAGKGSALGGHLKTGHRSTGQNRPPPMGDRDSQVLLRYDLWAQIGRDFGTPAPRATFEDMRVM